MDKAIIIVSVVVFAFSSIGCKNEEKVSSLEKEILSLRNEIKDLNSYISEALVPHINKKLNELPDNSYRLFSIERKLAAEKTIVFDFSEKGYGKLETSSGFFLVSVEDLKSYADGVKVVLKIGNPLMGKYKGFKMYVKYGPREPEFPKDSSATDALNLWREKNATWNSMIQFKELDFTEELLPGAWNKAEMILPKVKASELGYLELTMDTSTVSLFDKTK